VTPKGRMKILMRFIIEGKIVFFPVYYLLLQAKLTMALFRCEKILDFAKPFCLFVAIIVQLWIN